MWTSGFKNGWNLRCMTRKPHTSLLGRRMDSTWELINTQVPVTLTVAPALRKGTQTSKERVRTIPEQSQPQPDSPQKAVARGHVWGSRTARAGDAVSSNTGLFVTSGWIPASSALLSLLLTGENGPTTALLRYRSQQREPQHQPCSVLLKFSKGFRKSIPLLFASWKAQQGQKPIFAV